MTAINHALTGCAIALISGNVWFSVPAAIVSHFLCDALPHYGSRLPDEVYLQLKRFRYLLATDIGLCMVLVLLLALYQPQHWLLAAVCAFLATLPDVLWVNAYLKVRAGRDFLDAATRFERFARYLQWFQRPIGAAVEVAWFAAGALVLATYL